MLYSYKIAETNILVDSDLSLNENWQTAEFHADSCNTPEVYCRLQLVDKLPEIRGNLLSQTIETRMLQDNDFLWQETIDRKDGTPIMRCRFPLETGNRVMLWGLKNYQSHVLRSWVMWSAIDLPYLLLTRGKLTLHSSSVEHNGKAILFTAPSNTGKSTQADLWASYRNARVLNGDKNVIAMCDETAYAFGTPFSGTSKICVDYRLPLQAVVVVKQAPENSARRIFGMNAVTSIMRNLFGHAKVPGCMEKMISVVSSVLENVPVFELSCTPDERAVEALEAALQKEG